jgi:hypothetical protein
MQHMSDKHSKPADDTAIDPHEDELDAGVIAADDTGMLGGERLITIAELQQGGSSAGDV